MKARTRVMLHILLPDRLAFAFCDLDDMIPFHHETVNDVGLQFLTTDLHWRYQPLCADFGPVPTNSPINPGSFLCVRNLPNRAVTFAL